MEAEGWEAEGPVPMDPDKLSPANLHKMMQVGCTDWQSAPGAGAFHHTTVPCHRLVVCTLGNYTTALCNKLAACAECWSCEAEHCSLLYGPLGSSL